MSLCPCFRLSVCVYLSVCPVRALTSKNHETETSGTSLEHLGQVRVSKSSGKGEGYRNKNVIYERNYK